MIPASNFTAELLQSVTPDALRALDLETLENLHRWTAEKMRTDPLAFIRGLNIPASRGAAPFGTVMESFQQERFEALAPSLVALAKGEQPPVGKFWLEGTKGSSKDSDLAAVIIWLLTFTTKPLNIQIGAADQDQADELRKAAKLTLRLNPWLASIVEVQHCRIISKVNQSEALIIPADVTGSHGARPDVLILNECSHVKAWEFAENLMDNASKVPLGLVIVATNAGFLGTPAWKWREMARTSPRWFFHVYAKPAPWLDEEEIAEAKIRNSRERYMRLWFGVWSSGCGDAIDQEDVEACTTMDGPLLGPPHILSQWHYVAGLDLGIKHDHCGLVVLGVKPPSQHIRLAFAQRWKPPKGGEVDLEEVENAILGAAARYPLRMLYADPHEAIYMLQRLRRKFLRCEEVRFTGQNLDRMATCLMSAFRTQQLDLYPCSLQDDVMRLSIEEKPYGQKLTATSDADGHADVATAFAIALPFAEQLTRITAANQQIGSMEVELESGRHGIHLDKPRVKRDLQKRGVQFQR